MLRRNTMRGGTSPFREVQRESFVCRYKFGFFKSKRKKKKTHIQHPERQPQCLLKGFLQFVSRFQTTANCQRIVFALSSRLSWKCASKSDLNIQAAQQSVSVQRESWSFYPSPNLRKLKQHASRPPPSPHPPAVSRGSLWKPRGWLWQKCLIQSQTGISCWQTARK